MILLLYRRDQQLPRWSLMTGSRTFPVEIMLMVAEKYRALRLIGHTRWRSWLRHCATSRKVAGSIPDRVIGIFHSHNPSDRTMTLELIQPLTEMSTRNISWEVKAASAHG